MCQVVNFMIPQATCACYAIFLFIHNCILSESINWCLYCGRPKVTSLNYVSGLFQSQRLSFYRTFNIINKRFQVVIKRYGNKLASDDAMCKAPIEKRKCKKTIVDYLIKRHASLMGFRELSNQRKNADLTNRWSRNWWFDEHFAEICYVQSHKSLRT